MAQAWDRDIAERLIAERLHLEGPMLPILHALQDAFGCVPDEAVAMLAQALNISRAEAHGVVSFYHDFRRAPAGQRTVRVCRAESCQAMGGEVAARFLLAALGVEWGGTTAHGEVTVEPVYCLGLCAVSPAALVDGEPVGRLDGMTLVAAVRG